MGEGGAAARGAREGAGLPRGAVGGGRGGAALPRGSIGGHGAVTGRGRRRELRDCRGGSRRVAAQPGWGARGWAGDKEVAALSRWQGDRGAAAGAQGVAPPRLLRSTPGPGHVARRRAGPERQPPAAPPALPRPAPRARPAPSGWKAAAPARRARREWAGARAGAPGLLDRQGPACGVSDSRGGGARVRRDPGYPWLGADGEGRRPGLVPGRDGGQRTLLCLGPAEGRGLLSARAMGTQRASPYRGRVATTVRAETGREWGRLVAG